MSQDSLALVRRWFDEVWNQRKSETIHEVFGPGCIARGGDGIERGADEFVTFQQAFLGAFPDLQLSLDNMTADSTGEWVAARWTARGTHQGDSLGIPASGRPICLCGISLVRIQNGRFVAGFDNYDQQDLLAQLQPQSKSAGS